MVTRMTSLKASLSTGAGFALLSAALFGLSTPLAKLLLGQGISPWQLAAILYLGSGLGLAATQVVQRLRGIPLGEAPLRKADLPWLGLVVLSGGVIGPVLLMIGLVTTDASSASLLLNIEGVATMGIAWVVFRENVDRRLFLGALAILFGAAILSWSGGALRIGIGALAISGACLAWGIDNNLTRKLSSADPIQIATIKGLVAGTVNLAIALSQHGTLPSLALTLAAMVVGFAGYGVSLVLFVLGLRHLGAARTGAYFSTAPFIGATAAIVIFADPVTLQLGGAAVLMAVGLWFHLTEAHAHEHTHEVMEHEHAHVHDAHHQHAHAPGDPAGEPHAHVHRHDPLTHRHAHYPDLHHRHGH